MEMEVIWNGGPLLPPREERLSPMWRNMLTETEERLFASVMRAGNPRERIGTGRFCECGCGEEMTYAPSTPKRFQLARFKPGHAAIVANRLPRLCRYCRQEYVPEGRRRDLRYITSAFCRRGCQEKHYRARHVA